MTRTIARWAGLNAAITHRLGLMLGTSLVLASAGALPASAQDQVQLTIWSWLPGLEEQIAMFEEANPNIDVELQNVGQGAPHYLAFRNAIQAGTGAPDVLQMEFQMVPSFRLANALVDIGPLGAAELEDQYVDWAWSQVSDGQGVYAMPWDSGPMGVLYRQDIFEEHGLTVPTTWAEFEEQARALRAADPESYITNANFSNGGWVTAMLWLGGSRPFEIIDPTTIRININDEAAKEVMTYWQRLIDDDLVGTEADFTTEWYTALDRGRYASWITAAWGPVFLSQFVTESAGNWRAAPIPQQDAASPASANWGGSTLAVTAQSDHPEEAAQLAIFLTNNEEASTLFTTKQFLFPVKTSILESEAFTQASMEFYGNQPLNQIFIESAGLIDTEFQWSPFQDYVYSQMSDILGPAAAEGGNLVEALDQVQANVVNYARQQGFTVQE